MYSHSRKSGKAKYPEYIYDLPYNNYYQLCTILDAGGGWKRLAGQLEYKADNIVLWEYALMRPGGSAADEVLKDWSHRNPTPTQLFYALKAKELYRALDTLRGQVPACLFDDVEKERAAGGAGAAPSVSHYPQQEPQPAAAAACSTYTTAELPIPKPHVNYGDMTSGLPKPCVTHQIYNCVQADRKEAPGHWDSCQKAADGARPMQHPPSVYDADKTLHCGGTQPPKHGPVESSDYTITGASDSKLPANTHYASPRPQGKGSADRAARPNSDEPLLTQQSTALSFTQHFGYRDIEVATNHFCATNFLGKGGFGDVFKGRLKEFGCPVAIKRMKQDKTQMKEIETLMRFRHDNIINLYGYSKDGPSVCLVYQYMENGSLEDRLLCKGNSLPLTWLQRHRILYGAARGLYFLHSAENKPLLHGDIKSANILLDKYFEAKICDFDLARQATSGTLRGSYTHHTRKDLNEHVYGSRAYLPDEFFTNNFQLHLKTDSYSFGVVIYETATGQRAYDDKKERYLRNYMDHIFEADSRSSLLQMRDSKAADWPENLWIHLIELGHKATSDQKKERPTIEIILKHFDKMDVAIQILDEPVQKKCPTGEVPGLNSAPPGMQAPAQAPASFTGTEQSYHVSHSSEGPGGSLGGGNCKPSPMDLQMAYDKKNLEPASHQMTQSYDADDPRFLVCDEKKLAALNTTVILKPADDHQMMAAACSKVGGKVTDEELMDPAHPIYDTEHYDKRILQSQTSTDIASHSKASGLQHNKALQAGLLDRAHTSSNWSTEAPGNKVMPCPVPPSEGQQRHDQRPLHTMLDQAVAAPCSAALHHSCSPGDKVINATPGPRTPIYANIAGENQPPADDFHSLPAVPPRSKALHCVQPMHSLPVENIESLQNQQNEIAEVQTGTEPGGATLVTADLSQVIQAKEWPDFFRPILEHADPDSNVPTDCLASQRTPVMSWESGIEALHISQGPSQADGQHPPPSEMPKPDPTTRTTACRVSLTPTNSSPPVYQVAPHDWHAQEDSNRLSGPQSQIRASNYSTSDLESNISEDTDICKDMETEDIERAKRRIELRKKDQAILKTSIMKT